MLSLSPVGVQKSQSRAAVVGFSSAVLTVARASNVVVELCHICSTTSCQIQNTRLESGVEVTYSNGFVRIMADTRSTLHTLQGHQLNQLGFAIKYRHQRWRRTVPAELKGIVRAVLVIILMLSKMFASSLPPRCGQGHTASCRSVQSPRCR